MVRFYICRSVARKQYKDFDMSYEKYPTLLVVHGILHLKGHDHSTMEELEDELTKILQIKKRYLLRTWSWCIDIGSSFTLRAAVNN